MAAFRYTEPRERNYILSNLAASDAFHDFDTMSRISAENQALQKNVLQGIWSKTRQIGTLTEPTTHKKEDELFEELLGIPIGAFQSPGLKGTLKVLSGGPNPIEYEWETTAVYRTEGDEIQYALSSLNLFKAITGDASEPKLYFMIDAANVSLHKALIHDKGSGEKELVYIETRERVNDPADNRRMDKYVDESRDSKIRMKILEDVYANRINYPAMAATSTDTAALFNSIFSLSLEAKASGKTKEGLSSSILTFKRTTGQALKTITIQNGAAENENTVNSLYKRLVAFFKGSVGATALEDYFIALQQKRSGDWLQVLSTFDTSRYPEVPAGAPVFLVSLDRLCVLYGLCVGANMIYTFQVGSQNCITTFRRKQKRSAAERRADELASLVARTEAHVGKSKAGATDLADAPIVDDGIPYRLAVEVYSRYMTTRISALMAAADTTYKAIFSQLPELNKEETRFTGEAMYNPPLRAILKPVYDLLLFFQAFPPHLEFLADIAITPAAIASISKLSTVKEREAEMKRASIKLQTWESVVAVLRDLFRGSAADWATSEEAMRSALDELMKRFETSNREREQFIVSVKLEEDIYSQPVLAVFQQFQTFFLPSHLAPMKPLFQSMIQKASKVLDAGAASSSKARAQATRLRMNAILSSYVLFRDEPLFPAGAIPSFSAILEKVYVRPTPERKKNAFAIHRIIAGAYQTFVAGAERKKLVEAFLQTFAAGQTGGARTTRTTRKRHFGIPAAIQKYVKVLGRISASTAKSSIKTASLSAAKTGSLARKYNRDMGAPAAPIHALLPLYLTARLLQEYQFQTDRHPYESSQHLLAILAACMTPAAITTIHSTVAPRIERAVFLPFYYEVLATFFFVVLPTIRNYPAFHPLFTGFDLENLEELGLLLADNTLGTRPDFTLTLGESTDATLVEFLRTLFAILQTQPPSNPLSPERSILLAIRAQEGYRRKSSTTRKRLSKTVARSLLKSAGRVSQRKTARKTRPYEY